MRNEMAVLPHAPQSVNALWFFFSCGVSKGVNSY